jgi:hypothetical protein
MKRQRRELFATPIVLGCTIIATSTFLLVVAPAGAVSITDNFNASHDYTLGDVTGTIWTGMENIPLLQGQTVHDANTSNAGVLTVGDNGTFDADGDPMNGISGMGWEGGRSTSPFLRTDVPAGKDFTATVKISAQTSGQWSAAGLVARAANSPTPPGIGADHADENFATMYTFRTDAAIPDEGNTLMKRIQAGAQSQDVNIVVNASGTEPLPLVLKLEKVGGGINYRGWVSTDGGATYQFQSRITPPVGNALRDPAVGMEIGLSYMNFGTLAGTAQFDDFTLDTYDPLPAPGAPNITTAQTNITVVKGAVIAQLINDISGQSGPFSWVRTPNLPGTDAMILGAQGGTSALVPTPPLNANYFRWDTAAAPTGVYAAVITATNDWGEVSNSLTLSITIIPEPSTIALFGLLIVSAIGSIRRRR